jgi:hypothetical protein
LYILEVNGKVCLELPREPISKWGSDTWDNPKEVLPVSVDYVPFLIHGWEQGISKVEEAAAVL